MDIFKRVYNSAKMSFCLFRWRVPYGANKRQAKTVLRLLIFLKKAGDSAAFVKYRMQS